VCWFPFEQKRGIDGTYKFKQNVYNPTTTHANGKRVHDKAYGQHYSSSLIAYKLQLDGGAVLPAVLQSGLLYIKKQQEQEYRAQQFEGDGVSSGESESEELLGIEDGAMSECATHFSFSPTFVRCVLSSFDRCIYQFYN
jgi:hypothetical protein